MQRPIHRDDSPTNRKIEKHDTLLRTIAEDARRLAGRYPKETLVPEGGE